MTSPATPSLADAARGALPHPSPLPPRRTPLLVVAGLLLTALACAGLYLLREIAESPAAGLPLDDGWIHLQFARSLAAGDGLAYRSGTLVPGSTAPLWTALLSLLFWLPGPLLLWVKLLGFVLYLGSAAVTWALARELSLGPALAALTALLVLVTDAMVWSALSGMEVGLFVVLSVGATVLHLRERRAAGAAAHRGDPPPAAPSLALAVFGLAALARPEGLLLLGLAVADRLVLPPPGTRGRRALAGLLLGAACAALLVLAVQAFTAVVSGSPLPTTYAVKTDGPRSLLPSGIYLLRVVGVLFRAHPLLVLLAGAGALRLVERLGTARDRGLLPVLWTAALPLAYSLYDSPEAPMMVGNFGRYYFPLIPFVVVLGVLALARPLDLLARSRSVLRPAAAVVLAAAVLGPPLATLAAGSERYAANVRDVHQSDVAMALWLRRHVPPTALVAAQDIGAVGFFTPNPLLDLTGIVSPELLPAIERTGGGDPRAALVRYLEARRPDYLFLFAESYPGLLESLGAEVIHQVRLERNVTMAGSHLVLARTPWAAGVDQEK